MSITGTQIRVACGRALRDEENNPLMREVVTTSTSAVLSTTDLEGTGKYTSQSFRRWAVRGETSGVRTYGDVLTVGTGSLGISPSATLTNGEPIELWSPTLPDPDEFDKARDRALSQLCTQYRIEPLTYIIDGDFEASGVTNWTGSNATPTKSVATNLERFSDAILNVANSGANGYAGQTIDVHENEQWDIFAIVQATTGTAELTVQDLTGSAAVSLTGLNRSTWAFPMWGVMSGTMTIPADCKQISIRLGGQGAADSTQWAMIIACPSDMTQIVLPSRIVNSNWAGTFYSLVGTDWPEVAMQPLSPQPRVYQVGGGFVAVDFGIAPRVPIAYGEFANYSALQTTYNTTAGRIVGDAATTNCPLEYARDATLFELFGAEKTFFGRGKLSTYRKFETEFEAAHRQFGAKKKVVRWTHDAVGVPSA